MSGSAPPPEIRDRKQIESFVRRAPQLHLYELGDLDPFFWPYTRWWGVPGRGGELRALALLYAAGELPVLLALGRDDAGATLQLVVGLCPLLPARLYSHLAPGLAEALAPRFDAEPHGRFLKLALAQPGRLSGIDTGDVERLAPEHCRELEALYERGYPAHWFDPRMLETGCYFGVREGGRLVSAAGVHVYSRAERVAALGNVATDPARRRRGLARRTTARLCRHLLESVDTIGLNVNAENAAAIACYTQLGFTRVAPYDEYLWRERAGGREA